jgi:hypothetical protein
MASRSHQPSNVSPSAPDNRRQHDRVDYHTAVTVIADSSDGFYCIRSRSSDLSATGVRIVCHEPLPGPSVFLRILMPELSERFVEAEMVNERREELARIGRPSDSRYVYGLRFKRFVSEQGMLDRLRIVASSHAVPAAASGT